MKLFCLQFIYVRIYEHFLLITDNKFSSIGPIYYEYGSMVIIYEDSNRAVRALYALRESRHEDKPLLGVCTRLLINIFT